MALYNRVKVSVTGGAGALAIGTAANMFRGFTAAGIPDGTVVSYVIEDAAASAWEYGRGTYTAPSTFTRTTVLATSAGNTTPINAGAASFLLIDALAEDFVSSVTIGTTAVSGGTSGRVLFNNGGTIGEAANLTYDGTYTSFGGIKLKGGANAVTLLANNATANYTLTMPAANATAANQVLSNDGAGVLSWVTPTAYTLPAATSTTLGGVKANAGTTGQFVSGIAADGALTYATPASYTLIAPTATTLGGVKANVGSAGEVVSGIAADGSLIYSNPVSGNALLWGGVVNNIVWGI